MTVKVSVIIPAYNAEKFIREAIYSVLNQECCVEKEIIVIDDGSEDGTKEIVKKLSDDHPQIIYIVNQRKKGPSGARNTGLLVANGEYIAFLDADDIWLPNHLEAGISFLERYGDIDIVFFNFRISEFETKRDVSDWFTQRNFKRKLKAKELDDQYLMICDDMFKALLDECFIHLQSMIIKRNILQEILFNEDIKHSEDRDFCIKLYLFSKARFAFKDIITSIYFRHENSLSHKSLTNELDTALDHVKLFSKYLSGYPLDNLATTKLKNLLYYNHMSSSYYYRKLNKHRLSLSSLLKSFKYRITGYQFKEFSKIVVSSVIFNILKQARRSSIEQVGNGL